MTKKSDKPASVVRTSSGLRDAIFDELDAIRSGESNPTRANAVAKLAAGIVDTVRMDVEVQKHIRQNAAKPVADLEQNGLGGAMRLGSDA